MQTNEFLCWIYIDLSDYTNYWWIPSRFAGLFTLTKHILNNLLQNLLNLCKRSFMKFSADLKLLLLFWIFFKCIIPLYAVLNTTQTFTHTSNKYLEYFHTKFMNTFSFVYWYRLFGQKMDLAYAQIKHHL